MRLKSNFEIIDMADEYMLIPIGDMVDVFKGTVLLNDVSAFILNEMKSNIEKEDLLEAIVEEYSVSRDIAAKDLDIIIDKFRKMEIIE